MENFDNTIQLLKDIVNQNVLTSSQRVAIQISIDVLKEYAKIINNAEEYNYEI